MLPSVAFCLLPLRLVRARLPLFLLVLVGMLSCTAGRLFAAPPPQIVFTGVQIQPFSGSAKGIAVDSNGNVYLASGSAVYKETPGPTGFTRSTVVTNSKGLGSAVAVAVDSSGNVYVADLTNDKVLKETYSGGVYTNSTLVVDTVNLKDLAGIAVDGYGNVYVLDGDNGVFQIQGSSAFPVSTGGLNYPTGLAADAAGNLYISDSNHSRVLKETYNTGSFTESTLADSSNGLVYPGGVGVDASGNVYITDYDLSSTNVVYKETYSAGSYTQSTLPFTGLNLPSGVGVDPAGNIFLDDEGNARFLELSTQPVNFGSVAVNSPSGAMALNFSIAVGTTVGSIDVLTSGVSGLDFADAGGSTCVTGTYGSATNCVVNVKLTPAAPGLRMGAVNFYAGAGDTGAVLASVLTYGVGTGPQIAYGPGGSQSALGTGLSEPAGAAVDAAGNVFVTDLGTDQVYRIAPGGAQTMVGSGFAQPSGVAVDGAGNVYVGDISTGNVTQVTPAGSMTLIGSGFTAPSGIAVDGEGNVFIVDAEVGTVAKVTPSGVQTSIGSGFEQPDAIAVDASGNVYVGDAGTRNVYKITPDGNQTTIGSGYLGPVGVAVDAAGNLYVADFSPSSSAVYEVQQPSGTKTTLLTGTPASLAIDQLGNLYLPSFPDEATLTELVRSAAPSLTFATTSVGAVSTDSPQTFDVENIGNDALNFTGVSYPADFPYAGSGTSPCTSSTSVAPADECDLDINFNPQAAGSPLSESVTLTDNAQSGSQSVTVTGTATGAAPGIASANNTTFIAGTPGSFTVVATGTPAPTFSETGGLPSGVTLSSAGLLSGTPASGTGGTYPITITAGNGVSPDATQNFTLTVIEPPTIAKAFKLVNQIASSPAGATESGSTVTITTTALSGLLAGQSVTIKSVGVAGYNGTYTIATVPTPTTFTYTDTNTGLAASGGGTATATETTMLPSGTLTLAFSLTNPNGSTTLTGVSFTDPLPPGMQVAATPNASSPCGTFAPSAGDTTLTFSSGTLAPSGICNVSVNITATTAGVLTNVTNPVTSANGGTGNTALATVTVLSPPSIDEAFGAPSISLSSTTTLTFTIVNFNSADQLTGVGFTDLLPSGLAVDATPGASTSCGGTFAPNAGDTTLNFSSGTIVAAGTCTVSVNVVATSAGVKNNTTGAVTSDNAGTGNTGSATLTVLAPTTTAGVSTSTTYSSGSQSVPLAATVASSGTTVNSGSVTFTVMQGATVIGTPTTSGTVSGGSAGVNYTLPAGTPGGIYTIQATYNPGAAFTGSSDNTQTLTIDEAPFISSASSTTFQVGAPGSFTVTAGGYPTPAISESGPLPSSTSITDNGDGTATLTGEPPLGADGSYPITITASNGISPDATQSFTLTVAPPGSLVVNSVADDAGNAGNCTPNAGPTGPGNCSLRDALLEAASLGAGAITFDPTVFASAQTITLGADGALAIPSNTTINGATTGSGAALTNLVTVSGNNASEVFTITKGVVAAINNLIISDGNLIGAGGIPHVVPVTGRESRNALPGPDSYATGRSQIVHRDSPPAVVPEGGGIFNDGALTVSGSTISGNSVSNHGGNEALGGGIFNGGTLTLIGTTVSGNTASGISGSQPYGGGIYNASKLTLIDSTVAGNQASGDGLGSGGGIYSTPNAILTATNTTVSANTADGDGGGIYHPPATSPIPTLANTVVAGNTDGDSQDLDGGYTDDGGNHVGGTILLAALGNYGGPTQTMVPLPGSAAICGGTLANATAASITADQRGFGFDPLCPAGLNLVDAGAVQASYLLTYKVPPPPNVIVGLPFVAEVHLTENGQAANLPTNAIGMSDDVPALGGTTSANLSFGSATFTNLMFTSTVSGDTLTATLPLNSALTPPATVTARSSAINAYVAGAITSPAPGALPGPSVTFTWSTGTGATGYQLWVGSTGINSQNLYSSGVTTGTSAMVNNLPTNGETINVRLYTEFSGGWVHFDYTYTAATLAAITSPIASSTLAGPSVTFNWTPGSGATAYQLWVGSTSANSQDLYSSGVITGTSATVNNLPLNGGTIYVRLYAEFNGIWTHVDYVYRAATAAAITSPIATSTLAGPSVTFNWTAGTGSAYQLWVGSTGVNSQNLYSSGATANTSAVVRNLPTGGGTIYVRLYTQLNGTWVHADYTYTMASGPALTSPTPSSTLAGPSVTFTWIGGGGATAYQLWLGSTGVNSQDLYSSGSTTNTSVTVPNLPTNGETIYARLYVLINGFWNHEDYTFTAASAPALTSPAPGTTLGGPSATFTWSAGSGVTAYQLWVGSIGVNSQDIYSSGSTTSTSVNVIHLPTNGETIYVRLYIEINGVWNREDYTYTAYTAVP